ncbi:hypothetical protein [Nocardia asteroides]|uniref:hypothetical protein n=1 Tax=Nocardia asteroides TaxID=1824 RepID=UPI001E2D8112|nr:hypothetical protein [Nocardia asteroides]UGT59997.1 hypothetical protein LTT61_22610 [Nocardia asteroides]
MTNPHAAEENPATVTTPDDPRPARDQPGAEAPAATPAENEPDLGFTLGDEQSTTVPAPAPAPPDPVERSTELSRAIAREIAALGPEGWRRVDAVFAMTVAAEVALVIFSDEQQRTAQIFPSEQVLSLVRAHRQLSAELGDGPWWRYLLALDSEGRLEVDHDFGEEPFPDDHLFPAAVYRADLAVFPRARLPIWLAAYLGHDDRQARLPAAARADHRAGQGAVVAEDALPDLPLMVARWSVLAAVFVAIGSPLGPRVLPALHWFEGSARSGSSLYTLPGERAVLSGGIWDAPELDAVYNGGAPMPAYYAGAPEWLANPVLNTRAATGLLSFCYWWERGRWYRAESPAATEIGAAVPAMWSTESTAGVVAALIAEASGADPGAAALDLVVAAETGVVHRSTVQRVLGAGSGLDIDAGLLQLSMAGIVTEDAEPLPAGDALAAVRRLVTESGADTAGYPLERLRADRVSVGWMVYSPADPDDAGIGRAVFYVADDGVVEQASSALPPALYQAGFRDRFHARRARADVS